MRKTFTTVAASLACALLSLPATATVVTFGDFSSAGSLTLNGTAAVTATSDGTVLRLTSASPNQSGSAFNSTTINAATFSTYFKFRISNFGGTLFDCNTRTGADGLVFVVQNVSASIGGAGAGIGYQGINNSVGAEWDTWCNGGNNDPSSNHLGININGNVDHGAGSAHTADVAANFDDGNIWFGWVDYDGTTLEVRTNQTGVRPIVADLSRALDIVSILGSSTAYVGFTSGTGADWGDHDVLSWEYRDSFNPITPQPPGPPASQPVPLPGTLALVALALPLALRPRLRKVLAR